MSPRDESDAMTAQGDGLARSGAAVGQLMMGFNLQMCSLSGPDRGGGGRDGGQVVSPFVVGHHLGRGPEGGQDDGQHGQTIEEAETNKAGQDQEKVSVDKVKVGKGQDDDAQEGGEGAVDDGSDHVAE